MGFRQIESLPALKDALAFRGGTTLYKLHRQAGLSVILGGLLFGRVTYEMMEAAWRPPARTGVRPDWMADWMEPFARTIDAAKKYVVSSTLDRVDWNGELVRGDHPVGNPLHVQQEGRPCANSSCGT